jgi:hypothetical protein
MFFLQSPKSSRFTLIQWSCAPRHVFEPIFQDGKVIVFMVKFEITSPLLVVRIDQQHVNMARRFLVDVRIRNKSAKPTEKDLKRIAHSILLSRLSLPYNATNELKGRPEAGIAEVFVRAAKAGYLHLPQSFRGIISGQQTAVKIKEKFLGFFVSQLPEAPDDGWSACGKEGPGEARQSLGKRPTGAPAGSQHYQARLVEVQAVDLVSIKSPGVSGWASIRCQRERGEQWVVIAHSGMDREMDHGGLWRQSEKCLSRGFMTKPQLGPPRARVVEVRHATRLLLGSAEVG